MVCVDYVYWSLIFLSLMLARVGTWEEYCNSM